MRQDNFKIALALLNNAFDLLQTCIDILEKRCNGWRSPRYDDHELKATLINGVISVEVLLKAKISSINWRGLFQNPNKASESKLLSGNFYSVKFEDCIKRVESISNVRFDKGTKERIENIRITRNQLVHFYTQKEKDELLVFAAHIIDTFIEFYRNHIFHEFLEESDRTKEIDCKLKDIKEYRDIRLATIAKEISSFSRPKTYYFCECGNCLQDVFIIKDDETIKCMYCGELSNIKETAEMLSEFDDQTKKCPQCCRSSMVALHSTRNEQEAWDCIICGYFINRSQRWGSLDGKETTNSLRQDITFNG